MSLKDREEFKEGLKVVESGKDSLGGHPVIKAFGRIAVTLSALYIGTVLAGTIGFFSVIYLGVGFKISQQFSPVWKKAAFLFAWLPLVVYGILLRVIRFVK